MQSKQRLVAREFRFKSEQADDQAGYINDGVSLWGKGLGFRGLGFRGFLVRNTNAFGGLGLGLEGFSLGFSLRGALY